MIPTKIGGVATVLAILALTVPTVGAANADTTVSVDQPNSLALAISPDGAPSFKAPQGWACLSTYAISPIATDVGLQGGTLPPAYSADLTVNCHPPIPKSYCVLALVSATATSTTTSSSTATILGSCTTTPVATCTTAAAGGASSTCYGAGAGLGIAPVTCRLTVTSTNFGSLVSLPNTITLGGSGLTLAGSGGCTFYWVTI